MPKPNMHPDNYVESSGALAGKFEIVSSLFKVHQANQREGQEARGATCAQVFKIHPITDDGDKIEDAAELELVLALGGKSLGSFHPGTAENADDAEPEDLGDEVGTEGNSIYSANGALPNAAASYSIFNRSLAHKGFDKKKIADCYAPHYVGLKFELATVTPDKLEAYGSKARPIDPKVPFSYKVVQSIIEHPKAAGSKKAGKAAPGTTKTAAKTEAPAETTGAGASGGDDDAADVAFSTLQEVAKKLAGQTKKLNGVKTFWLANYKGEPKLQKAARDLVNNPVWLAEKLEALDAAVSEDSVTFAEAA